MTMQQQPTRDRAAYQAAYHAAHRAAPMIAQAVAPVLAPPAPLRLPLRPVPKPEPERRAVQRPPWRFGMHRTDGVRFGDEDWEIRPANDPARSQPGCGSAFGRSQPAPIR
jgi:hypothetical protein